MISAFSMFARLRVRLAATVALALAPVGVLAFVQALDGLKASATSRDAQFQSMSLPLIDRERKTLGDIRRAVSEAAIALQSSPDPIQACDDVLARLAAANPSMTAAGLISPAGAAVCGSERSISVAEATLWRRFLSLQTFTLSAAQNGAGSGRRMVSAWHPLPDPAGRVAAIAVSVELEPFGGLSTGARSVDGSAILDVDGVVMLAGWPSNVDADHDWLPEDRAPLRIFGDRAVRSAGADGVERVYFTSALEPGQLWAVSARAAPSLGDLARSPEATALLIPVLLWCIAVGVTYFAIDRLVSRHIERLRAAAVRIGQGDLETPVGEFEDAPRELRALGHAIKAMATRLASRDERLQETLETQRRLLLEVHHRVKNNLQTISSFMNLGMRSVADPETQAALRQVQTRIHALALVHQNLYAAENLERIALDRLLSDLCRHLGTSLAPRGCAGQIVTDLAPVIVDTQMAAPIALFLSEAVGNAHRHGDAASPALKVTLTSDDDTISVSVSNRARSSPSRRAGDAKALEAKLMVGFARQLGGRLETARTETTHRVTLVAPLAPREGLFSIRSVIA